MIGIRRTIPEKKALACVMGSMNLVRPIGLAGIRCAVVARSGSPTFYSRFTKTSLHCEDFSEDTDELVERMVCFGQAQAEPPVLFFEEDAQLLLVSRYRDQLSKAFRFMIADAQLVEDLVDKTRFQVLAERLALPVPPTRCLRPMGSSSPPDLDLRFPLIIKPATRGKMWKQSGEIGKARQIDTRAELRALWPQLVEMGQDLLAQEMIPGPETRIESYHVYVDPHGALAAEFTGRKIRTYPLAYGHTTALTITDDAEVRILGRALTAKLNLRGVAKFDFKRDPDGVLHLLEVNPRFNLWHFPAALAGVNLPALVYADMVGIPRPAAQSARAGVRWCHLLNDRVAAQESGMTLSRWMRWALSCEAKSAMAWDDPMPLLRGVWYLWSSKRTASALPPHAMQRGKSL